MIFDGNAGARVRDLKTNGFASPQIAPTDAQHDVTLLRVFDGIAEQVDQHLLEVRFITFNVARQACGIVRLKKQIFAFGAPTDHFFDAAQRIL